MGGTLLPIHLPGPEDPQKRKRNQLSRKSLDPQWSGVIRSKASGRRSPPQAPLGSRQKHNGSLLTRVDLGLPGQSCEVSDFPTSLRRLCSPAFPFQLLNCGGGENPPHTLNIRYGKCGVGEPYGFGWLGWSKCWGMQKCGGMACSVIDDNPRHSWLSGT